MEIDYYSRVNEILGSVVDSYVFDKIKVIPLHSASCLTNISEKNHQII